jgi:hypothetical protein
MVWAVTGRNRLSRIVNTTIDMADIVQIPIEAFNATQHTQSIYDSCIYNEALHSVGKDSPRSYGYASI